MKKFLSFILAALLAVTFSAFTPTGSAGSNTWWYEDPDDPGTFLPYNEPGNPCEIGEEEECFAPIAEKDGRSCPIFYDQLGEDPLMYDPQ